MPDRLGFVFIAQFASGPWEANCYLVGAETDLVAIDPGIDSYEIIESALKERGWNLVGVFATHGHVDHIGQAAELANAHGVPLWMHEADDFMLTEPAKGLSWDSRQLLEMLDISSLPAPERREYFVHGQKISIAGLEFSITEAPGHSPGCCLICVEDENPVIFVGDVVFAGSIGRTDLPRGDVDVMKKMLATKILPLDDSSQLFPGHGPATTMAKERAMNPYLQPEFLDGSNPAFLQFAD